MSYRILFTRAAERAFERIASADQPRIAKKIDALASDPRPRGALRLAGEPEELYRIRVGDYRVIYGIEDEVLTVLIVRVAHRRDVYR
ncbi:MAG: type II toxin-antitoxin system RelE/ParE family toxin [Gemmatimonadaceae bacterium]